MSASGIESRALRLLPEAVPRRHAVVLNFSLGGCRFQIHKSVAHTLEKIGAGDVAELRFRIVQVVDVDAIDAEIAEAAGELIFEKARSHAVAAGDDVVGTEDARLDVFAVEIIVGIAGHFAVGRQVAALGAEDEFVAGEAALGEFFQRGADVALAALEAVVDRGVDAR